MTTNMRHICFFIVKPRHSQCKRMSQGFMRRRQGVEVCFLLREKICMRFKTEEWNNFLYYVLGRLVFYDLLFWRIVGVVFQNKVSHVCRIVRDAQCQQSAAAGILNGDCHYSHSHSPRSRPSIHKQEECRRYHGGTPRRAQPGCSPPVYAPIWRDQKRMPLALERNIMTV
jgi:hypothetical protein